MEERRGSGRLKRSKAIEEGYWDCTVCTYKNSPEAFKCDMCDVRKGTSTRKPRINAQLVAQQVAQQYAPPQKKEKNNNKKERSSASPSTSTSSSNKKLRPPRLKNVDRSSATTMEVTVGNVTVIITDYKPKKERRTSTDTHNNNNNNTDSRDSSISETLTDMNGDLDEKI